MHALRGGFLTENSMDDETKAYLDALMGQMNDGFERILEKICTLHADFLNTKAFLLEDFIITGRRVFSIEERLTKLERKSPD